MIRRLLLLLIPVLLAASCSRPSPATARRAEKHRQDSLALIDQQRTLAYYQGQLETLLPKADSLLPMFKYERNERYQDHGYYVATARSGTLRILVRDDGGQPLLLYLNGKRISTADDEAVLRAEELQTLMRDIRELEKRIDRTSLEVEKYHVRLRKYEMTQRHE